MAASKSITVHFRWETSFAFFNASSVLIQTESVHPNSFTLSSSAEMLGKILAWILLLQTGSICLKNLIFYSPSQHSFPGLE